MTLLPSIVLVPGVLGLGIAGLLTTGKGVGRVKLFKLIEL
jgi:hypothetical protein